VRCDGDHIKGGWLSRDRCEIARCSCRRWRLSPNRRSSEPAGAPSSSQVTYPQGSDTRHTAFDLPPYRTSKTMEIIMAVVRCDDYSPYGMTCPQCNDLMIAPRSSAYVSCNSALHCWSCDTCGHDAEIFDRFVRLNISGVETYPPGVGRLAELSGM
jgi:hypothetical protein